MEDKKPNRFEHPALENVYQAVDAIKDLENQLKSARLRLHEAVRALPEQIGENDDLRDEIFHHLYWFDEDVPANTLKEAFQYRHVSQARKADLSRLMRDAYIESVCIQCSRPYKTKVTSRSDMQHHRGMVERALKYPDGFGSIRIRTCEECRDKNDGVSQEKYRQQQAEWLVRLEQLRAMPYREYLQTPEWQERRKKAMKRAGFRCQVCNAYGVRLNTHHRTYERRGNENDRDLIVLCENCHTIFHENGSLAKEN